MIKIYYNIPGSKANRSVLKISLYFKSCMFNNIESLIQTWKLCFITLVRNSGIQN